MSTTPTDPIRPDRKPFGRECNGCENLPGPGIRSVQARERSHDLASTTRAAPRAFLARPFGARRHLKHVAATDAAFAHQSHRCRQLVDTLDVIVLFHPKATARGGELMSADAGETSRHAATGLAGFAQDLDVAKDHLDAAGDLAGRPGEVDDALRRGRNHSLGDTEANLPAITGDFRTGCEALSL
jgi:hypothetical protein